jgi:hypothetical protein
MDHRPQQESESRIAFLVPATFCAVIMSLDFSSFSASSSHPVFLKLLFWILPSNLIID